LTKLTARNMRYSRKLFNSNINSSIRKIRMILLIKEIIVWWFPCFVSCHNMPFHFIAYYSNVAKIHRNTVCYTRVLKMWKCSRNCITTLKHTQQKMARNENGPLLCDTVWMLGSVSTQLYILMKARDSSRWRRPDDNAQNFPVVSKRREETGKWFLTSWATSSFSIKTMFHIFL
jgi:hypothetical protein